MKIAVFCGSREGNNPAFREGALALGREIGRRGWTLVYGGATEGLMGLVADAVLKAGGQVHGILTEMSEIKETPRPGLTVCERVKDLDARKARLLTLGEAYVALPGGPGTLEELSEAISLARLKVNDKKVLFLNLQDYYTPLEQLLDHMVEAEFIQREDLSLVFAPKSPKEVVSLLEEEPVDRKERV